MSTKSQSNQLYSINQQKILHDDIGNQLQDQQGREYHYNEAGKLIKVTQGENTIAEYVYNAFSQRVKKTTSQGDVYFSYDLNGQLIQESGQTQIGYLWLDGQPIAQLTAQNDPVYLISDHLNTPRIGVDKNKEIVWQWNSDAFGTTKAKGQITMSLRFPGQYEDKETGLFYNWHRYYNPTTGRYITSDPIGLNAGINTYAYVGGNPVNSYDLMGLAEACDAFQQRANQIAREVENRGDFAGKGEADLIYSLNSDSNLTIRINAANLTITSNNDWRECTGASGYCSSGRVSGAAYAVHGQITIRHRPNGTYGIYNGRYDFEMHGGISSIPRNIGAFFGEPHVFPNRNTPFTIAYYGNANITNPRQE